MSWSLSMSGHTPDAETEKGLIEDLRSVAGRTGALSASVSTQHHGVVDLLAGAPSED